MIEGYTQEQFDKDKALMEATQARMARNLPPGHPEYDPFYDDSDEVLARKALDAIEGRNRA